MRGELRCGVCGEAWAHPVVTSVVRRPREKRDARGVCGWLAYGLYVTPARYGLTTALGSVSSSSTTF